MDSGSKRSTIYTMIEIKNHQEIREHGGKRKRNQGLMFGREGALTSPRFSSFK
jgi:hypothetical protein